MPKISRTYTLEEEAVARLEKLAEADNRSASNWIETTIMNAALPEESDEE